jgi:phosphohistidine swiveling domain-containing protein
MKSLFTVAKSLNVKLAQYFSGKITKEEFLKEYGHLRPGTYDIMSLRYDENFEKYFDPGRRHQGIERNRKWVFSKQQKAKIDRQLSKHGFKIRSKELLRFIQEAIEGREFCKFVFTRSVSEVLRLIETIGTPLGMTRAEMSFLDIKTVLSLYSTLDHRDLKDILRSDIEKNKLFFNHTKAVKLPALIRAADDVYSFALAPEDPTFITLKRIEAAIATEDKFRESSLDNKIVLIRSADPGYDFLFTKNIGGLITQFGGANSHMAIRCAELGIPAVIGAGEKNYQEWASASVIEIDSLNRRVKIIS